MGTDDKFPWELLKAECLRLVCAQLVEGSSEGQRSYKFARKEEMVTFLRDVHERGVVKALEDVEPPRKIIESATPLQRASPSKRKSVHVHDDDDDDYDEDDEEEDAAGDDPDKDGGEGYNTRYKGVKRVKVHGYSPEPMGPKPKRKVGRPRKSAVEGDVVVEGRKRGRPRIPRMSVGGDQIKVSKGKRKSLENGDANAGEVISRPRGRPRKKLATETNGVVVPKDGSGKKSRQNAPMSKDSGREVFDGILLVRRNKDRKEGGAVGDHHHGGALNDDERDGSEEDAVVAAVNGDAQGDLSSLGGSNKARFGLENEHISATYTPDPDHEEVHDIDADGEFEPDAEALV